MHSLFSYSYNFPNVTGGVYSRENSKFHRSKLIYDYSLFQLHYLELQR